MKLIGKPMKIAPIITTSMTRPRKGAAHTRFFLMLQLDAQPGGDALDRLGHALDEEQQQASGTTILNGHRIGRQGLLLSS